MINDYYEYTQILKDIIENNKIDEKYSTRFINILARRFTYIFLDDNLNFKNDYYNLVDKKNNDKYRYCRKRLRLSKQFIKFILSGEYDVKIRPEQTKDPHLKFKEYFYYNLRNDGLTDEEIDTIYNFRINKEQINLLEKMPSDEKIEFANMDAVIEGPLRKNIGIVYSKEQILKLIESCGEMTSKKMPHPIYSALNIMILSYYFYYYNMTHKTHIPFILEHHKLLHGSELSNYFHKGKKGPGIASFEFIALDTYSEGQINSVYLSKTKKLEEEIIKLGLPKVITVDKDTEVLYQIESNNFVYVDKGKDTFKELQEKLVDIRNSCYVDNKKNE